MRHLPLAVLVLAAATSAGGCESEPKPAAPGAGGPLAKAISASATSANVPRDLLVAIAQVEDGLRVPKERKNLEVDTLVPAAGPLQLRHGKRNTLARGAEIAHVTELDLRKNSDLALDAGAKVLAEIGASTNAKPNDLTTWETAIGEMGGFADEAHRKHYIHRVFSILAHGGSFAARDGETIVLAPHDIPPWLTIDLGEDLKPLDVPEYPNTNEWIQTSCANNKCETTRNGRSVVRIIIHDTEGSWESSVATLQNDSGKSVHYIVNTDGHIGQFIPESFNGFHAGNRFYNETTVGIEHVNLDGNVTPYPEPQYAASAKLVDYLAAKYAVPRDRAHIIGHDQVPDLNQIPSDSEPCAMSPADCESSPDWGGANNHRDPGIWEWGPYMARIGGTAKCNDVPSDWTCAVALTSAFHCPPGGTVEVRTCSVGQTCKRTGEGAPNELFCTPIPGAIPVPPGGPTATTPGATTDPDSADGTSSGNLKARKPKADGCSAGPGPTENAFSLLLGSVFAALLLFRRRPRPCHHSR